MIIPRKTKTYATQWGPGNLYRLLPTRRVWLQPVSFKYPHLLPSPVLSVFPKAPSPNFCITFYKIKDSILLTCYIELIDLSITVLGLPKRRWPFISREKYSRPVKYPATTMGEAPVPRSRQYIISYQPSHQIVSSPFVGHQRLPPC
jgi:hypothetical protein